MAKLKTIASATLLAFAATPAFAQLGPCVATDPPFLAEGPIEAVSGNPDGSGTVTAMGITITVPAGTPVYTPTADLGGMQGFAAGTPFPGRTQPGFIGGTVISTGCVKTDASGNLVFQADDVTSDVNENVLLGVVTSSPTSNEAPIGFGVQGTQVEMLTDARMPAEHLKNAFGFEVIPTTVPVGASAAVEGYFATDGSGVLHAWAAEVGGGDLVDPVNPQVSILRSRCDGELRVQGAIYQGDADGVAPAPACNFAAPYSLRLYNADANQEILFVDGDQLDVINGVAPDAQFCSYTMRLRSIGDAACPPNVRVDLLQSGVVIASATTAKEVPGANALPVANANTYQVLAGQTLVIPAPGLLANDTDADGDPLTAALVVDAQDGELVFGIDEATPGDGSFSYTPEIGFSGIDTFVYRAVDSKGGLSEPVTVTIVVAPVVNTAPVAGPDAFSTDEGTALTIPVATLLANDTDADGQPLSIIAVDNAVNGTAALVGTSVVFTPLPGFAGNASFTYTVTDGLAAAIGSVAVTVTPVNDPPVAQNDVVNAVAGTPVTISVLGNDFDFEGQALTVANLTQPAVGGTVANNGTSVTFTPTAGFAGTTSFTYQARDSGGALSNVATVSVNVTAPVVVDLDIDAVTAQTGIRPGRAVTVRVDVRNNGTVNGSAIATLRGVSTSGEAIPTQTIAVSDPVGGRATRFPFSSFTPTRPGTITWTVTIADSHPDVDQATATTVVR
jgi:hypothetical protein